MDDPTRRPEGSWPRDRPVRWRGVGRNLTWFIVGTAALGIQVLLAGPVLAMSGGIGGTILALIWGVLTLLAARAWLFGEWRVVLIPIITVTVLALAFAIRIMATFQGS